MTIITGEDKSLPVHAYCQYWSLPIFCRQLCGRFLTLNSTSSEAAKINHS